MPLAASVSGTLSRIVSVEWLMDTLPVDTPTGPAATGGGTYTGTIAALFEIEITAVAAPPDSFHWRKNGGAWTDGTTTDGSPITLSDGVTVTFTSPGTFGHDLGDAWQIIVSEAGQGVSGTLEVGGYSENPAAGTLEIDRTLFKAFYSRVRLTRPDVYLGGYLMTGLVDSVSIEESIEDPIQYATFTLSDKRVAYFDADSLSRGQKSVGIDLFAGPPGFVIPWEYAFVGDTESSTNSMPYRPRGQFRTVSRSAKWADAQGCLNLPAMSGLTRGQVLAAFAESAGVIIVNAAQLGGARVTKKLDIAGVTPFQLLKEFGEIEGWIARPVRIAQPGADSLMGLEIISEDRVLKGAPIFDFDESNTYDVPETTPDRPVTNWVLSTTRLADGPAPVEEQAGTGSGGGTSTGGGGTGPQGPPGPAGPSGVPTLITSTGGSPGITGTIDGAAVSFTTAVNSSVASLFLVFVDGANDFDATWSGTTLTTSSAPITSVRIFYWSA